ncbi:MAG: hypothetical protein IIB45_06015 [Candidatus Marinimicrobia bacterium]|nr:hypothetical protein [Candidatus Neomarinimicrobiota bacterium]
MVIVTDRVEMTIIMSILSIVFILVEYARMRVQIVKSIFSKLFNPMMRKHELDGKLTGATWVVIISVPIIYFFPKEIAVLSLVFMSVGDSAASIIGQAFGKTIIGSKSLEGTLGCFAACVIALLILDLIPLSVGLSGAIVATIFEALPLKIDDNVLIPVTSGTAMVLVSSFIV